jgi:hypothetical protein
MRRGSEMGKHVSLSGNQTWCVVARYHEREEHFAELFVRWIFEIGPLSGDFAFFSFWEKQRQRFLLGRNVFCCDGELWCFDRGACSTCFETDLSCL